MKKLKKSLRERILQVKHTCENLGAEVFILQADLSTRDGTDQLIAQIPTNIDALVYHAGMDSVDYHMSGYKGFPFMI